MAFHGYNKWFCTVKSLKSVTWKTHLKMMQSFFLHNSFSIIQVMGLNMTNLETDLKKIVMPLTYGFSWLQAVILYSKITKVSDIEGSFDNDAVILFVSFFFHYSSHVTKWLEILKQTWKDCNSTNLWHLIFHKSCFVQ